MTASARWFRNLFCVLAFCITPLLANCVCVPPRFNSGRSVQCTSDAECSAPQRCLGGVCRIDSTECTSGIVRSCFLGGASACQYGEQSCLSGRWSSCVPKTSSALEEVCDGIDNDCDGSVDESFPERGQKCVVLGAKGACAAGTYDKCTGGQPQCVSVTKPRAEGPIYNNCSDGIDNDCDGFTDDPDQDACKKCTTGEKRKCYPHGKGPTDPTVGIGVCKVGEQTCTNGTWSPCQGAVTPTPEQCNDKLDNDCDGKIDNTCNDKCDPIGSSRPCYDGPAGTEGKGLCVTGVQVCGDNAQWGVCKGQVVPQKEDCADGKDNDCNGKIDDCNGNECRAGDQRDCYAGPAGTQGVGICKAGKEGCTIEGKWSGICQGQTLPGREQCGNKLDDNCNGKVDDCNITQIVSTSWDKLEPIKLWDTTTNTSLRSFLKGHNDTVYAAVFSPDGKTLFTSSHDKLVVAWEVNSGKILWSKASHTGAVHALAIDPNGKWLASGSADNTIRLWNPLNGADLGVMNGHTGAVYSLAASPGGKRLVSGSADTTARMWDLTNLPGKTIATLKGHALEIFAVAYAPKGDLVATGSRDTTIKLWKTSTNTLNQTLSKHTKSVTALAFASNGNRLASGSADNSTIVWDMTSNPPKVGKTLLKANSQAIYALTFHPAKPDTLVAGSYSGAIIFWNAVSGQELTTYTAGTLPISALAYRP